MNSAIAVYWHAAAAEARRYIAGMPSDSGAAQPGLVLGAALFETGDLTGAARAFESAGTSPAAYRRAHPYESARHRAWALTHCATVAAARIVLGAVASHRQGGPEAGQGIVGGDLTDDAIAAAATAGL